MKITTRLSRAATAALCVAGLGLAACGDDEETTPSPTTTTGVTGAGGPEIDEIREQFDAAVRSSLEAQAAAGASVDVDCAIERLNRVLTDEEVKGLVDAFAEGTPPPPSISESLTDVRVECAE